MLALASAVLAARERGNATTNESNASSTSVTRGSPWPEQEELEELFGGSTAMAWSNLGGLNASLPASSTPRAQLARLVLSTSSEISLPLPHSLASYYSLYTSCGRLRSVL